MLDLKYKPPPAPAKTELEVTAEKIGVTTAKLQAMRVYVEMLKRSDKRIKQSTIRSKVLQKFKIHLT